MGKGADTTTGRALMRGLRRSVRDMAEEELRANLTDIRDRLNMALESPEEAQRVYVDAAEHLPAALADASYDQPTFATGE